MENPTAGVTGPDKSPDRIEHEMEQTRESITEKVSLLENQVKGTIQSATDNIQSVTSAVTDTVQAVKEAVSTAPAAVSDTVKQTLTSVKDTVAGAVSSVRISECVRDNPWASVGTSAAAGFLVGLLMPGGRRGGGLLGRPLMARGHDTPAPAGRVGGAHTAYAGDRDTGRHDSHQPGMFGDLFAMAGRELRQLAEQALSTGLATLKQSVSAQVPQLVDTAVHRVTDRVADVVSAEPQRPGARDAGTTRVGGPNYTAAPPVGL